MLPTHSRTSADSAALGRRFQPFVETVAERAARVIAVRAHPLRWSWSLRFPMPALHARRTMTCRKHCPRPSKRRARTRGIRPTAKRAPSAMCAAKRTLRNGAAVPATATLSTVCATSKSTTATCCRSAERSASDTRSTTRKPSPARRATATGRISPAPICSPTGRLGTGCGLS